MLHYQSYRHEVKKSWVVFIHGAGGGSSAWQSQWEVFKKEFNVLAMDLRDHGKSKNIQPSKRRYTFKLIADDILRILEHEKIQKAHFVTLSFGSVLIQDLSMRKPELVKSVILAGGVFKANILVRGFIHLARFFNLFLSYPQMYRVFSKLLMPKERHRLSRRVYQIHATKISNEEYLRWLGLYSTFFLTLKRFYYQKINFPALVIMGSDDYVFLKAAKAFAGYHHEVEIKVLQGAGHICNIDNPKDFNRLSLNFLKKITSVNLKHDTVAA
ncbi:MAG: alpha/beta hydrolase [Bacteroidota bacterium]